MKEFRCSIANSIIIKALRNGLLLFVLYLLNPIINFSSLIPNLATLLGVVTIYLIVFFLQVLITNNDLIIEGKVITIHPSLIPGIGKKRFQLEDIEEIEFKDEWTDGLLLAYPNSATWFFLIEVVLAILIPGDYKWIKIRTRNRKTYRYYFFGLSYDYYDNSEDVLFEDMFLALANRDIKVKWKSIKSPYFEGLQNRADKILKTNS